MTIFHYLYIALGSSLALVLLPVIWFRWKNEDGLRTEIAQRLGMETGKRRTTCSGRPRLWIHAVSVGEVKAAETVIQALDRLGPYCSIVLTTTTRTGQQYACRQLARRAAIRFAPLDLWGGTGRFLSTYRPDVLVCMETELWPNWLVRARRAGMTIAILNGRISSRSIRSYLTVRPLLKPVLNNIDLFSMISNKDARRIQHLGAPSDRIFVNGDLKMDARDRNDKGVVVDDLLRKYAVNDQTPVFIAGSIRGMEAEWLIDVFLRLSEKIPDLVFIIAPRHIENAKRIADLASARGIPWQYRTELEDPGGQRHASLVILNIMGELRSAYAIARVVFCGGSLVPLGGQNLLEAAVQAKPVLYGPFMDDFDDARKLMETAGGGECVKNEAALTKKAIYLLSHPEEACRMGQRARKAVLSNRGAALRHAKALRRFIL